MRSYSWSPWQRHFGDPYSESPGARAGAGAGVGEPETEPEMETEPELEICISPENRDFPCKPLLGDLLRRILSWRPSPEPETEPPKTYIKETGCSVEILFLKREEVLSCSVVLNSRSRLRLWSVHSGCAGDL